MAHRNLTEAQKRSKRYDEIACRISFGFAGLVLVWQIVLGLLK